MKSIETKMLIKSDIASVWDKVCFYEEVKGRPTWFLRMTLPLPERTIGDHKTAGTICRCEYSENQYILKRITRSAENEQLAFEVVETSEQFERYIRLRGGTISLTSVEGRGTMVAMVTNYDLNSEGFFLRRFLIERAVKALHRFVIKDMADSILAEQQGAMKVAEAGL